MLGPSKTVRRAHYRAMLTQQGNMQTLCAEYSLVGALGRWKKVCGAISNGSGSATPARCGWPQLLLSWTSQAYGTRQKHCRCLWSVSNIECGVQLMKEKGGGVPCSRHWAPSPSHLHISRGSHYKIFCIPPQIVRGGLKERQILKCFTYCISSFLFLISSFPKTPFNLGSDILTFRSMALHGISIISF